jgi:hypothetical protein
MDYDTMILDTNLMNLRNSGDAGGFLQRGRRRSKKDNAERNNICGCGKDYLSYPALYTHVKQKHNGEAPPGTTFEAQNKFKGGHGSKFIEGDDESVSKTYGHIRDGSENEDDQNSKFISFRN